MGQHSFLAVGEVGAGSWGDSGRPSGGVGVTDGSGAAGRAVGVVWAGGGWNVGGVGGGGQVGGDIGDAVTEGVVGAGDRVDADGQELAGSQADEGGKNSLGQKRTVIGLLGWVWKPKPKF
jgi:hypothetical protein